MWHCVCGMGAAVGTVCPRLLEAAFGRQVGPDPEGGWVPGNDSGREWGRAHWESELNTLESLGSCGGWEMFRNAVEGTGLEFTRGF